MTVSNNFSNSIPPSFKAYLDSVTRYQKNNNANNHDPYSSNLPVQNLENINPESASSKINDNDKFGLSEFKNDDSPCVNDSKLLTKQLFLVNLSHFSSKRVSRNIYSTCTQTFLFHTKNKS